MSEGPSPNDLVSDLRSLKEDEAARTHIEMKRWLSIIQVLLPAALRSAAEGDPIMHAAVNEIWPLLPKTKLP